MKIRGFVLALFGALFSFSASAVTTSTPTTVAAVQNGFQVGFSSTGSPLAVSTRSFSAGAASGEALIMDMLKGAPGPGGRGLDIGASRSVSWGSIARAAGKGAGWLSVGMIVYDVYDRLRVRPGAQGFTFDEGQDQSEQSIWAVSGYGNAFTGGSPDAAVRGLFNKQVEVDSATSYRLENFVCTMSGSDLATCEGEKVNYVYDSNGKQTRNATPYRAGARKIVTMACPPVVDFGDPRYSTPGGPPGEDGKCPTGRYSPITEAEAETKLLQSPLSKDRAVPMLEELVKNGAQVETSGQVKVSGVPKVESQPSTKITTKPDGTTTTTTTKEVSEIKYEGNTYTWNTTNVTVNSDGSTTTETKPEPPPEVLPPPDPGLPERPKLYEQKYPDGIKGVWEKEMAGIKNTPIFQFLSSMNPGLGDAGCPKWGFPGGDFMGLRFASGDVSLPCSVWFALKAVIIVSAFLLARRLVFGG